MNKTIMTSDILPDFGQGFVGTGNLCFNKYEDLENLFTSFAYEYGFLGKKS